MPSLLDQQGRHRCLQAPQERSLVNSPRSAAQSRFSEAFREPLSKRRLGPLSKPLLLADWHYIHEPQVVTVLRRRR